MNTISVKDISEFLNSKYYGNNFVLIKACSLDNIEDQTFSFSKKSMNISLEKKSLILVPLDFDYLENSIFSVIKVENPRLEFAKVVNRFFIQNKAIEISNSSKLGKNCVIKDNVSIGENCVIGDNVIIEEGTIINHNVVICDNVRIGKNCYIKSGAIIGEDGFGFDFEDDGTPIRIPHIGNVEIGDNVEIGAKNTIARATLGKTIIENNVKTDDQVHIAHNCKIGKNTIITSCAEISGSVIIGQNCWIGPNSSIIQKVKIGNNVTIGIGSVITEDIPDNKKMMGLEGLDLRSLIKLKKRIEYGN